MELLLAIFALSLFAIIKAIKLDKAQKQIKFDEKWKIFADIEKANFKEQIKKLSNENRLMKQKLNPPRDSKGRFIKRITTINNTGIWICTDENIAPFVFGRKYKSIQHHNTGNGLICMVCNERRYLVSISSFNQLNN